MNMISDFIIPGSIIVAQILAVVVPVLISVAFLVYAERKVLALIQLRRGPNIVGPFRSPETQLLPHQPQFIGLFDIAHGCLKIDLTVLWRIHSSQPLPRISLPNSP